jgi:CSLREA domain-containing protein
LQSRTWAAVLAAFTFIATFVAVPSGTASAAVPPIAVTAGKLTANGAPFTFSGMNVYNANSDGTCWDSMATSLDAALTSIGPDIKVLRSWFFQDMATTSGVRDWTAFDRTISTAAAHGMYVLPVLGNQWNDCDTGYGFKTPTWYTSGYKTPDPKGTVSYRDWVAEFSARYGQNPNLLAIELLNEPETSTAAWPDGTCPSGAADLLRTWAADVSAVAKTAGARLISLGTIGSGQCGTSDTQYADLHALPDVDLCSFHDYSPTGDIPGDQWNGLQHRLDQCATLGKPLYVGETGIRPSDVGGTLSARAERFAAKLTAQVAAGSAGLIAWAWNSNGSDLNGYDIGPGDPALAALRLSAPSTAAFVVDSAADTVDASVGDGFCSTAAGACTLRAAVQEANAEGVATVDVPPGTFTLSLSGPEGTTSADDAVGDLDVTGTITIRGAGSSSTTVNAAGLGDRLFETFAGAEFSLAGITLSDGHSSDGGALKVSDGSAALSDVLVTGSHSTGPGGGVSVSAPGLLEVSGVTIRDNTATGLGGGLSADGTVTGSGLTLGPNNTAAAGGGGSLRGAFDLSGPVVIRKNMALEVGNNPGDGGGGLVVDVQSAAGPHQLTGALVEDNEAADGGGIVSGDGVAPWRLTSSTIYNNRAREYGGGMTAIGSSGDLALTVTDVTIDGNKAGIAFGEGGLAGLGGGLAMSGAQVTLNRVAVTNNEARGGFGGGIFSNGGTGGLTATNLTVTGNDATQGGTAHALELFAGFDFMADHLVHATVAANGANGVGGSAVDGGQFSSSVITQQCDHAVLLENNVVSGSCGGTSVSGTNRSITDVKLGPLADNGGPTFTMLPQPGSPLIDPPGNADLTAECPALDQRGLPRPQDGLVGGAVTCDIGAVEAAAPKILTVSSTGQGTVTSAPAGITCPSTCNAGYPNGSVVTLTATAAAGWQLTGWGGACTGTGACTLTMTGDSAVSATFEPLPTFPVTVSLTGNGTVTSAPGGIDCPTSCEASFRGTVVLTATPGPGQVFTGWGGACSGTTTTCDLNVSAAQQVSAAFAPAPTFPVTVSITGTGRVTSAPAGIDCPGTCSADLGGTVVLTEAPGTGQVFTGWGGACSGATTTCTLSVTQARQVTAGFRATAAPIPNAGPDVTVNEGAPATLSQFGSSSPDGLTLTYAWSVDGGASQPGASITVTFGDQGIHTGVLTVCDTNNTCATDSATITVRNVNPTVQALSPASPVVVRINTELANPVATATTFTVSAVDVPADPLTYGWTFGDGSVATTSTGTASRSYPALGARTAAVTVNDGDGGTAAAQWTVRTMALGTCVPTKGGGDSAKQSIIASNWGGAGAHATVVNPTETFTFGSVKGSLVRGPGGVTVNPGDILILQKSGSGLQSACDGTRYLQVLHPASGRTVYVRESSLLRT